MTVPIGDPRGRLRPHIVAGRIPRRSEKAAAALAHGVGPGTVVVVATPDDPRSADIAGHVGAPRRDRRIRSSGSLSHREWFASTRQVGAQVFITPGTWRDFSCTAMVRDVCTDREVDIVDIDLEGLEGAIELRLPTGDTDTLPAPPDRPTPCGGCTSTTRRARRRRPKGARHTDESAHVSVRSASLWCRFDRRGLPVPSPFPHRRYRHLTCAALTGSA